MKPIETVGVVGRGALGVSFAHLLTQALGPERVLVLADRERVRRYEGEALLYNGRPCPLHYVDTTAAPPVDLLLFSTKFGALRQAAESCRRVVTPETTLLSVLNGISSEEVLGELFSPAQIVWCVAQKMSAKKEGSVVTVEPVGELAIGVPEGYDACHLRRLTAFFDGIGFPYSLPPDIRLHMWSKLLCNTGCRPDTIEAKLSTSDAAVVGTYFKAGGQFEDEDLNNVRVDQARVEELMAVVYKYRETL